MSGADSGVLECTGRDFHPKSFTGIKRFSTEQGALDSALAMVYNTRMYIRNGSRTGQRDAKLFIWGQETDMEFG